MPLLGCDVAPHGSKLVVNQAEAERVRAIFALYLEQQALLPLVQELARQGWVNKRGQTRKGRPRGGQPFTPTSLRKLLSNCTYRGQVRCRTEVHRGEHPALIAHFWFRRIPCSPDSAPGITCLLREFRTIPVCYCRPLPA